MTAADGRNGELLAALEVARSRTQQKQAVSRLVRFLEETRHVLEKEGIAIGSARGSKALMKYIGELGPAALTVADKHPPESRAHRGAQLIGLISSLLSHWVSREKEDLRSVVDVRSHDLSFQIGHFAGMLELDVKGMFLELSTARLAKKGRADGALKSAKVRTAWHEPALAKARRQRERYPNRATSQIATSIDEDSTIKKKPSYMQLLNTLYLWEKTGALPRKKLAPKK